jgi:hypothetical protein
VCSAVGLATANTDLAGAHAALSYLEANTDAYVTVAGSDGPGELATLILAAHALGVDPTQFGGTNLVTRLLATEQTSGPNAGRFGTDAQVPEYDADGYSQGLALAALHAAGVQADTPAISWLEQDQCPDGGWTAPDTVDTPCNGDPADYEGPDPQTTALAIEGLAAQGIVGNSTDPASGAVYPFGNANLPRLTAATLALHAPSWAWRRHVRRTGGYWLVASDGGVFSYGDAAFFGSRGGQPSTSPSSAWRPRPTAAATGWWPPTAASSATATPRSTAPAAASRSTSPSSAWRHARRRRLLAGGLRRRRVQLRRRRLLRLPRRQPLNKPIVGMASDPNGAGYWLVASDGGIFNYGDAAFFGSTGASS